MPKTGNGVGYIEGYEWTRVQSVAEFWPNQRAELAREMLCRWGLIAGEPDGEDAAGRQKMRLLTPEELVARACAVADLAFQEFRRNGWLTDLPFPIPTNVCKEGDPG